MVSFLVANPPLISHTWRITLVTRTDLALRAAAFLALACIVGVGGYYVFDRDGQRLVAIASYLIAVLLGLTALASWARRNYIP